MQRPHPMDENTPVTLTIDPLGPYPIDMPAEEFATVCDAIGLRGLAQKVGVARLGYHGEWTFKVGDDGYRMKVA